MRWKDFARSVQDQGIAADLGNAWRGATIIESSEWLVMDRRFFVSSITKCITNMDVSMNELFEPSSTRH